MSDLVGNPEDRFSDVAAHVWVLESREIILSKQQKTKGLISLRRCAVEDAELIWAFLFAYVESRFSHHVAHMIPV